MSNSKKGIKGQPAPPWGGVVTEWHQHLVGRKTSLDVSDYRGKVLFLYFFESWCPACHRVGFPTLQRLHEVFGNDSKVGIVAIQTVNDGFEYNTAAAAKMCVQKYGLPIPVGQSSGGGHSARPSELLQKYNVREGPPWTVIIDQNGIVRYNKRHVNTLDAIKIINILKNEWEDAVGFVDEIEKQREISERSQKRDKSQTSLRVRNTSQRSMRSSTKTKGMRRKSKSNKGLLRRKLSKGGWLSLRSKKT